MYLYTNNRDVPPKENGQELFVKKSAIKEIPLHINIGDRMKCPECETLGRVVWVSQNGRTVGVRCGASHVEISRTDSKYGPRVMPSTKTRKNLVFLTTIEQEHRR